MNFLEILKYYTFKSINYKLLKNKIHLDKENNFENFYVVYSKDLIKTINNKDVEILNTKIKLFLMTMQNNCKNFDSHIFTKNFKKTLFNIEEVSNKLIDGLNGFVIFNKNIFFKVLTFDVVYHELLHLSSLNREEKKVYFVPFNEGYTQLLAERYFSEAVGKSYMFEVLILKNIESILGRDYMEKIYFKGNFHKIIFDLYKYESMENVAKFIFNVNEVFKIEKSANFKNFEDKIQNLLNEIFEFLFCCLKNKISKTSNVVERKNIIFDGVWCNKISIYDDENLYKFNLLDEKMFNEFVIKSLDIVVDNHLITKK